MKISSKYSAGGTWIIRNAKSIQGMAQSEKDTFIFNDLKISFMSHFPLLSPIVTICNLKPNTRPLCHLAFQLVNTNSAKNKKDFTPTFIPREKKTYQLTNLDCNLNNEDGFYHSDDSVKIQFIIRTIRPRISYGLRNHGNTCYINSIIQILFHIPEFCQSIYSIPTDLQDKSSIILNLQALFNTMEMQPIQFLHLTY